MSRKVTLVAGAILAVVMAVAVVSTASADHNVRSHVSVGSTGGNGAFDAFWVANAPSGSRVYFETQEKMVAADTDSSWDIYERAGSTTTLISIGPTGGNGAFDAVLDAVSSDGTRVFFTTKEKLVSGDTDSNDDIYERSGTTTTQISTGSSGGNGAFDAFFGGASQGGTRVFFETDESLVAGDTDTQGDVYQRQAGTTTHLSTGPTGGNGAFFAGFLGNSQDGTRVFIDTDEKLVAGDTDSEFDIYERNGATTTLISIGPGGGNGAFPANWGGISADGTKVIFETEESLLAGDTDAQFDIYQRQASTTTQISTGSIGGNGAFDAFLPIVAQRFISSDASHVFFETEEALASGDTDAFTDVYDRSGGTTTRISTGTAGNGAFDAFFLGASSSGTTAFFESREQMIAGDTDAEFDIFKRVGSTTTRESTGTTGGNGAIAPVYVHSSADAARVFFETAESLEAADTDTRTDVYERQSSTTTTRISTGTIGGNGAFDAFFDGASDDGTRAFFDTQEALIASDTDTFVDVYAAISDPLYARPGAGTPFRIPLVQAYRQCTSPNSMHVAPLNLASCNPPVRESSLLTVGTNGTGSGFASFKAVPGNAGTTPDEADFVIEVNVTDVRQQAGGADYTGQVVYNTQMRMTDRSNGFDGQESGTVQDFNFGFAMSCVGNGVPTLGSSCSLSTTTDTLVPGFAKETKRTIISSLSNNLLDVGADGVITPGSGACPPTCGSGDEKAFLHSGVFLP